MKLGGVLVVGLLLGLAGGLIYTWFVEPVQYYDTYPPMLAPRYRQDWIGATAWAYGVEGNWDRTRTRLLHLSEAEVRQGTLRVLEEAVVLGQPTDVLQRLAWLAAEYGATGPGVAIYTGATMAPSETVPTRPPLPTPTTAEVQLPGPTATAPPAPTSTPAPGVASPYHVISQTLTCEAQPRIGVSLELSRTVTERGREVSEIVGLPNREVWLIWDGGADRAITGFRPEIALGYADFIVEPGHRYHLYVDSPVGLPIFTVQVEPCAVDEEGWVSRLLIIREKPVVEEEEGVDAESLLETDLLPEQTPAGDE